VSTFNAYVAGFFDGEGCITIKTEKGTPSSLSTGISQKDIKPLKRIKEIFGGSIYYHKPNDMYQWRANNDLSYWFLLAILPYLIVKKEQALLAIEYQHLRDKQGSKHRLTEQELSDRLEISFQITSLKKVVNK
jgi:hypothetical protein